MSEAGAHAAVAIGATVLAVVAGSSIALSEWRPETVAEAASDVKQYAMKVGENASRAAKDAAAAGKSALDKLKVSAKLAAAKMGGADTPEQYATEAKGDISTPGWRMFFSHGDKAVSPWHDIPLTSSDGLYNFVCEIPKDTTAKMECCLTEPGNPIKQDIKKGELRFYPYNINWNYGFLPQTWEDPAHRNEEAGGVYGDGDPVDVVEVSSAQLNMGGMYQVKCVGVYAMIDDGELDWKVIAINAADPLADKINDVEDVEREMPGLLQKVMEWFRDYKIPAGKPENKYGFDSKCLDAAFTKNVIEECHGFYKALKNGTRENDVKVSLE